MPGRPLVTLSAMAPLLAASLGAVAGAPTDVDTLKAAACEAGHAYASRDIIVLDRLTAQDYSQTDVRGTVLKRAEWLEFVRQRASTLTVECDSLEVNIYHGTAVVTGGWTDTNHQAGGDVVTRSRWTSVWTKERARWQRHAFQNTYVNPAADRCAQDLAR